MSTGKLSLTESRRSCKADPVRVGLLSISNYSANVGSPGSSVNPPAYTLRASSS